MSFVDASLTGERRTGAAEDREFTALRFAFFLRSSVKSARQVRVFGIVSRICHSSLCNLLSFGSEWQLHPRADHDETILAIEGGRPLPLGQLGRADLEARPAAGPRPRGQPETAQRCGLAPSRIIWSEAYTRTARIVRWTRSRDPPRHLPGSMIWDWDL